MFFYLSSLNMSEHRTYRSGSCIVRAVLELDIQKNTQKHSQDSFPSGQSTRKTLTAYLFFASFVNTRTGLHPILGECLANRNVLRLWVHQVGSVRLFYNIGTPRICWRSHRFSVMDVATPIAENSFFFFTLQCNYVPILMEFSTLQPAQ